MSKFSKKKIRGFKRKIKQLNNWGNFIISYPFDEINSNGTVFRVHLPPFIWHRKQNISRAFHKYFYKLFLDVLIKLKENKLLKKKEMIIQLWLFYPRIIKSLVIVAPHTLYIKRNNEINAITTKEQVPKLIAHVFKNFNLKKGEDNIFKLENTLEYTTIKVGNIWTVD